MKTALYGRIIFGASAAFYGAIALLWHDVDTWQTLSALWRLPLGAVVGAALMVAQLAAGLALPFPRTARAASIVLVVVYAAFAIACIPAIVAAPGAFTHYDSFFEQFSLLSGAIAAYALTLASTGSTPVLGRAARLGLGCSAISFTLAQAIYLRFTAALVPAWIPPNQMFWAILTTIAFGLAAIAILINRQARLAMRLMSLMMGCFGVLVWIPLLFAHPEAHVNWSEFALTILMTGAAATVADLPRF